MIIAALFGGLGNQMFQYANARALALRNKTSLRIDRQFFNENYQRKAKSTLRNYELSVFNLEETAVRPMMTNLITPFLSLKTKRGFDINIVFNPLFIYEKEQFKYQQLPHWKFLYLYGYWQSWRYFQKYEDVIRKDFAFKNHLTGKNLDLLHKIKDTLSVSVHIRLGDYTTANVLQQVYYRNAIDIMKQKFPGATFFVFSDTPDLAKTYFNNLNFVMVVGNTGTESYIDMQLMSNCRHNIIANSSFSWWGAWLNTNPDKSVIAPSIWYNNRTDSADVLLPAWLKI